MFVLATNVLSAMGPTAFISGQPAELLFTASICQAEVLSGNRDHAGRPPPPRMIRTRQRRCLNSAPTGEVRFVNRLFRLAV